MSKVSHADAGYHEGYGKNGHHCAICKFFEVGKPVGCQKVADPIRAGDGCDLFQKRGAGVAALVRKDDPPEQKSGGGQAQSSPGRPADPGVNTKASPNPERDSLEPIEVDDVAGKDDEQAGEQHWGYHLIVDMSRCNRNINDNKAISRFFDELVTKLGMQKLGGPTIYGPPSDQGGILSTVLNFLKKYFGAIFYDVSGVKGRGVTAFQVITTSHISFHSDDDEWSVYCDVFSCAPYDPEVAIECVKKWFAPKHLGLLWLYRDAGKWPEK
jgi:S-adenosylmethionine decarboxylase